MADGADIAVETALVVFTPSGKRGRFPIGTPVLTAARKLGVDLDSVCGGRGICSKCQVAPAYGTFSKHGVTVHDHALSDWNRVEERYRSKRGMKDGRRLGCQAAVQGDVVIDVPPESQAHKQVVRKRAEARDIRVDAATRLYYIEVVEPDMHHPSGDLERVRRALREQWQIEVARADLAVVRTLQPVLRKGQWAVTCAVSTAEGAPRIVGVWPGFFAGPLWGVAVDIGSTTIACHLTDLTTGAVTASAGVMNPQIRFGEDLMSRVSYSMMNPGGDREMTASVREALQGLCADVATEGGIRVDEIMEASIVGNPIMHHLLLGIDPVELGGAPFALATGEAMTLRADELGLSLHPGARVYLPPCVAGHVGADCAAVILSESPQTAQEMTLVVDVGTNAEIVLGDHRRVLACSSPTGPAFEGAQISCGQRAAPGAIERVRIDPETKRARFRVIGCELWSDEAGFAETAPGITGIAGSGIIEAIAEMRLAGVIDEDGVIRAAPGNSHVVEDGRTFAYILYGGTPEIRVTQNDVRAIQLAKAALYAGIRLLMDKLDVETVERIVLAGAFGAHISPLHAVALGMVPDCPIEKIVSAGNAAGTGARIALVDRGARAEIERVVGLVEKIETAIEPRFQDHFVAAMAVPHKTASYPNLSRHVTLPVLETVNSPEGDGGRRRRRRRAEA